MVDFYGPKGSIDFAQNALTGLSPERFTPKNSWTKTGCLMRWIEWSGSRRNPEATPCQQENCTVEYNGRSNYLVTLPSGQKIVRRDGDYGFKVLGGTLV